jgi:hypothetical protein
LAISRYRRIRVCARLEVNLDQAHAGQRARLDVLDVTGQVKKRSKRPVMSLSICSGGIPEKNVATTTTGM